MKKYVGHSSQIYGVDELVVANGTNSNIPLYKTSIEIEFTEEENDVVSL